MIISEILQGYGPLAAIVYLIIKDLRNGGKQISAEAQGNYKAVHEQDKETISQKDTTIGELRGELKKAKEDCLKQTSHLHGIVEQQTKTIAERDKTISNRNPDLMDVLKQNLEINARVANFMEMLITKMDEQTQMLETGQKRNEKIDEATEQETGHVLRKK